MNQSSEWPLATMFIVLILTIGSCTVVRENPGLLSKCAPAATAQVR